MGGWPEDRFNPLHFFFGFLLFSVIMYWLHEFWHIVPVLLFGGNATVRPIFAGLPVFVTDITVWPSAFWQQCLVCFAGGWVVALVCWFLLSTSADIENRIIWHAIGWAQFGEGSLEGLAWMFGVYEHPMLMNIRFVAILAATLYALAKSKRMWSE